MGIGREGGFYRLMWCIDGISLWMYNGVESVENVFKFDNVTADVSSHFCFVQSSFWDVYMLHTVYSYIVVMMSCSILIFAMCYRFMWTNMSCMFVLVGGRVTYSYIVWLEVWMICVNVHVQSMYVYGPPLCLCVWVFASVCDWLEGCVSSVFPLLQGTNQSEELLLHSCSSGPSLPIIQSSSCTLHTSCSHLAC